MTFCVIKAELYNRGNRFWRIVWDKDENGHFSHSAHVSKKDFDSLARPFAIHKIVVCIFNDKIREYCTLGLRYTAINKVGE